MSWRPLGRKAYREVGVNSIILRGTLEYVVLRGLGKTLQKCNIINSCKVCENDVLLAYATKEIA